MPAFCHADSPQPAFPWAAVIEKAAAKLCGSYQALLAAPTAEVLEMVTGAPATVLPLSPQNDPMREERLAELWNTLDTACGRQSIVCLRAASTVGAPETEAAQRQAVAGTLTHDLDGDGAVSLVEYYVDSKLDQDVMLLDVQQKGGFVYNAYA